MTIDRAATFPREEVPRHKSDPHNDDLNNLPSMGEVETWVFDSVCEATDGCTVEPDGTCPHGRPSWLLRLGLV